LLHSSIGHHQIAFRDHKEIQATVYHPAKAPWVGISQRAYLCAPFFCGSPLRKKQGRPQRTALQRLTLERNKPPSTIAPLLEVSPTSTAKPKDYWILNFLAQAGLYIPATHTVKRKKASEGI